MKILLYNVTTSIKIGGVETFYWAIASELIKHHNVTICSGSGSIVPNTIKNSSVRLEMFKFIPRQKIPNLGNRFRKFMERVSFYFSARDFLKSQKFDIVVLHKPFDFFVAYLLKKVDPGIKTIFVSGGEDFYFFDKFFIKFIDKIISVSASNAKILQDRYNKEVSVVCNGVDKSEFYPDTNLRKKIREELGVKDDEILLGSVGRVVGLKGFDMAIGLLVKFKEHKYMLVGDGEALEKLKKTALDLGVSERVIFVGSVEHDKLNAYYNAMDIYIQPSIGHEAFGITLIEALACDKICVASDNGGMKDIVQEDINGYKFKIGDNDELFKMVQKAFLNLGKLAPRASIEGKYEWKNFADEIALY
ncbi:glycosyltransferase family 4 protein [Campylobacter curvus]|uniref:glycosyltransferase family 4 protein n=1 Tax=Campylobacter curvus TaxID=200 RepID=UPI00147014F2|nr:glycosyltransferase family 4 protein [Campylobacter curvus]